MSKINYANLIIYKLVHKDDFDNENIYIGSTTNFMSRFSNHKDCCKNEKKKCHNNKKYQYIRDNGGWDCFNMIEVEKYPCIDGNEARAREEYWRSFYNSKLNIKKAHTTHEERLEQLKCYYQANMEKMKEQMKQRYLRVSNRIVSVPPQS